MGVECFFCIREIDKSNCDDSEEVENVNIRTYDLHKIENYIANNIKVIEKNASLDDSTTPPPSEKNNNQELDKQIEASTDKIDIVDEDLPLGNITKKTVNEESDNHVLINIIDNLEIEECIQKRTNNNFSQPQQNDIIILEDSDSNDFDGIIQQKSTDFPKSRVSTDDTLNLLEELVNRCITNLNATTPDIIHNQLSNMLTQILKLKTFINPQKIASCNSWAQTNIETDNVAVQTRVDNNVATVQTDVHVHTVAIQTQIDKREVAVQTYFNVNSTAIQTEYIDCFRCQDREINSLVHSQNPKNRMVSITNKQINNFDTTEHSIESNKSKPSSQNDIFSATLDNLIFDTQEISKNQGIILKSTQKHICQGVSYPPSMSAHERKISQSNKEMSQQLLPSVLVCTVESSSNSNNVNRKLIYEPDRSRFKRIRAPTSDSDSDGETEPKKLCNRFVRDDLTVEFQTNSIAHNESQNSDNINYDDYLTKVMKKYEDSMCNTPAKEALDTPASKKKFIKEIVNKCEEILDSASRNIVHIKEMADISTSSKDSFQTASQSINNLNDVLAEDNVFIEDNLRKMENDIRDYEIANLKAHNTENSDIVVDTDDIAPAPKKAKKCNDKYNDAQSASLFSRSEHVLQKRTISEDKVCDELNDGFDDAIWENINICEAELYANRDDKGTKASKITVINNVVLKSPKKRLLNMEEDDLFSDEDIVETTPQKKTNSFAERPILSQINNIPTYPNEELPKPLTETENFEFDVTTLPPPPDFQDTCQRPDSESEPSNNDTDDHTILNHPSILANLNKSSLTPDELSQFIAIRNSDQYQGLSPCITSCTKETKIKGNSSLTPNKFRSQLDNDMEKRKILHSTPVTQRKADMQTLGFSPIEVKHVECTESISKVQKKLPEKKRQHDSLIDLAQSSKYMPLSFVSKDTPKKHNILTSKPNQKSIWNYVRPAGSMEVKETLKKSKPEIACSRLTKAQIDDIQYEMVEKGLSTYSSMFSMSVTHMVVAVNEDNCLIDYTTKFVAAVAAGIWVLRFEWIEECLRRNCIVEEEPYEVLDPNGSMGAKTSRLTRKANPLFKGYKFYCADPFISITKDEIKEIITLLGGKVVANIHDLLVNDGHIVLIIKGEGNATEEFEVCERWIKVYKAVTVDLVWLSKCVGQYRVATVRPYILGDEEENLEELNYPSHLLELVPLSLSETL